MSKYYFIAASLQLLLKMPILNNYLMDFNQTWYVDAI